MHVVNVKYEIICINYLVMVIESFIKYFVISPYMDIIFQFISSLTNTIMYITEMFCITSIHKNFYIIYT